MPKPSLKSSLFPILLVAAATIFWVVDAMRQINAPDSEPAPVLEKNAVSSEPSTSTTADAVERTGRYETYRDCTLVEDRGNDGDSFLVRLPGGRTEIIRLYFVDAPESRFRTYAGGRNNHQRIQQQADALGGITPQQAVEVGKEASRFVIGLMEQAPFTLHTEWDSPFNDRRYHGFIELSYQEKTRLLHEILVEKGLVRIHTKGADLANGTKRTQQITRLRALEKEAKSNGVGAWGL